MTGYAAPIQRLIQELGRLPGIGEKTATRLAMFILRWSPEEARRPAESLVDVKEKKMTPMKTPKLSKSHRALDSVSVSTAMVLWKRSKWRSRNCVRNATIPISERYSWL